MNCRFPSTHNRTFIIFTFRLVQRKVFTVCVASSSGNSIRTQPINQLSQQGDDPLTVKSFCLHPVSWLIHALTILTHALSILTHALSILAHALSILAHSYLQYLRYFVNYRGSCTSLTLTVSIAHHLSNTCGQKLWPLECTLCY